MKSKFIPLSLTFIILLLLSSCTSTYINSDYNNSNIKSEKIEYINAHRIVEYQFFNKEVQQGLTDTMAFVTSHFLNQNKSYSFSPCNDYSNPDLLDSFFDQAEYEFDELSNSIPSVYHSIFDNCSSKFILLVRHKGHYETTGHQVEKATVSIFASIVATVLLHAITDDDENEDEDDYYDDDDSGIIVIAPSPPGISSQLDICLIDSDSKRLVLFNEDYIEDDPSSDFVIKEHIYEIITLLNRIN